MKNKIKLAMTTVYLSHWQLPRQLCGNRHCLLFIATSSCHDNQPPHLSLADCEHPALLWFLSFASPSLLFITILSCPWFPSFLTGSVTPWSACITVERSGCHISFSGLQMWPWHRWEWQVWDEYSQCNILGLSGETNPVFACFPLFFLFFFYLPS